MDPWVVWLAAAVILAGLEVASPGFLLIMFSGGALAAAAASAAGATVVGSAAVFTIVSVALIAFVRPVAKKHMYQPPLERSGTAALIGSQAVVIETVDASDGRIKLAGEVWSARSFDEDASFEPGTKVSVLQIEGATAIVA